MYLIGKIVGTHGIKGEVKVKADTSFDRFKTNNLLYLKIDNKYHEIKIRTHRKHKKYNLITFDEFTNINEVLKYVGCDIYTPHNYDDLNEDEFFYEDLIGKKVIAIDGDYLGDVIDIREVPQGIILEIKTEKDIKLIPFVSEFVKEINDGEIIISPIEGLI